MWKEYLKLNNKKAKNSKKKKRKEKKRKQRTLLKDEQKFWINTSPKKLYRWQLNIWKDAQHHISLGSCKLK